MEIIKKTLFTLIFLLVVVLLWLGLSVFYQNSNVDINPNASSYTEQLRETFDLDELEEITDRTERTLPITPDEFSYLIEDSN